jgi:hypothetical protein
VAEQLGHAGVPTETGQLGDFSARSPVRLVVLAQSANGAAGMLSCPDAELTILAYAGPEETEQLDDILERARRLEGVDSQPRGTA